MKKGLLFVLSGPSGAGKGTIYNIVINKLPNLKKSISVTTRKPRDNEKDGVQYYFRSVEEFNRMKENGEFLETAQVYDNFYGTPLAPALKTLDNGEDVFFEIDIQGAKQIKAKYPESVMIFLMPPSFEVLEKRLRNRGTESEDCLKTRIGSAKSELAQYKQFDYIVFNDELNKAAEEVAAVITAERLNKSGDSEPNKSAKEAINAAERLKISRNADKIEKMLKTEKTEI